MNPLQHISAGHTSAGRTSVGQSSRTSRRTGQPLLLTVVALVVSATLATPTFAADAKSTGSIEYNRDIRPILAENCFACHGPDSASRKADLRVDQREAALEAGTIVPGDPSTSAMIERIFSTDADVMMPPPATRKKLTQSQKKLLRQWIAQGAEYQPHWSFIPPKNTVPPPVQDSQWVRNPIDNFVLARLEEMGLSPAPEADRRTLARRVSLDLLGLPPSPADVEAFVTDASADAYEKYVDRLLESEHWGEHRGRFWLDAARYADTHGIHFDNYREIWAYREWVINAFNRNLPFDQFTIEQLAGDLLPDRTLDQQIASGFNRCNITTNEGGIIDEEYRVLYTRDRTETTSLVWMGLTAGCAVCHDHKFDPLSQREFYEMSAFFNNSTQGVRDGNIKDTPPIVFVPQSVDRERWDAVDGELAAANARLEARKQSARTDFETWLTQANGELLAGKIPTEGLQFQAALDEGSGGDIHVAQGAETHTLAVKGESIWQPGHISAQALQVRPETEVELADLGKFEKDQGFSYGAWVKLASDQGGAIFARMDDQHDFRGWDLWVEGRRVGAHIINTWPSDALKVVSKNQIPAGEWNHVWVTYDGSGKAAGIKVYVNGQPQPTNVAADNLKNTIQTEVPFKLAQRHTTARMNNITVQDIRIYDRALPADEVERLAMAGRVAWLTSKPADQRTAAETDELFNWWLPTLDQPYQELNATSVALTQEKAAIRARGTIAHVMQEREEPAMAYVLARGEYDKRQDEVKPTTPAALPALPEDFPRNRLGFARWLLLPEHPLTARVTVNRFWQQVFGRGIVRTAGDFGITGDLPTHPELLDWLAIDFRESGWDMKRFFRQVVTSATYRQSAVTTPDKLEADRDNALLSRGPRFRMDAEMVRDYALAVSGLLVPRLGGPSVKPYQPDGVWEAVAMIGSNTRNYEHDRGENLYRRSMYTFWKRSAPPASMDIFNAPSREVCTVQRERTNTPLQALVTLNDPQFVEAARNLAQRTLLEQDLSDEDRLNLIAGRLLSRPFRDEELAIIRASLTDLQSYYNAHPEAAGQVIAVGDTPASESLKPSQLAAWTMLANQLMNLDEVLTK